MLRRTSQVPSRSLRAHSPVVRSVDYWQLLAERFSENYPWLVEASSSKVTSLPLGSLVPVTGWCRGTKPNLFASVGATCNSEGPSQVCCNCIMVKLFPLLNPAFFTPLVCCSPINCLRACLSRPACQISISILFLPSSWDKIASAGYWRQSLGDVAVTHLVLKSAITYFLWTPRSGSC